MLCYLPHFGLGVSNWLGKVVLARVAHREPELAGGAEPFGTYAPGAFQALIVRVTRALPDSWLGRRAAFALRRAVTQTLRHPLDMEVFGQRMRLVPFNNVAEKGKYLLQVLYLTSILLAFLYSHTGSNETIVVLSDRCQNLTFLLHNV